MRTDVAAAWCLEFTKLAQESPKERLREAAEEISTGLLAGADPSGSRAGQLAIETARGGGTKKQRDIRTGLAMAGGAAGGSFLVPMTMSAIYGGIMGGLEGKGLGRATGAVSRAAQGVWGRATGLPKGRRGLALVRKAMNTGQPVPLDDKDIEALKWFSKRAPVASMDGKIVPKLDELKVLQPETAADLERPARSALTDLAAQYTVGGALGAAGALGHFRRGEQIGREIEEALHTPVPQKKGRQ